jgi:glycosyltransferase involved in cell wall biosynthesis
MNQPLHHKLSVLIKTFDRKRSLVKLLRSLQRWHPDLPVLIADDSKEPYRDEILSRFPQLNIQYYTLPFDTGLAAGRNYLLEKITTPYFLLCDDDFVADHRVNLATTLMTIAQEQVDIGGGTLLNYTTVNSLRRFTRIMLTPSMAARFVLRKPSPCYYTGNYRIKDNHCTLSISYQKPAERIHYCDIVCNFFIGKTASIKAIHGWDEQFKVGEHEDFFYRAKLRALKVAWLADFMIAHYPVANPGYLPYRQRAGTFKRLFVEKSGFGSFSEIDRDTSQTIFSYQPGNVPQ